MASIPQVLERLTSKELPTPRPNKRTYSSFVSSGLTNTQQIQAILRNELRRSVYLDTNDFVKKFFYYVSDPRAKAMLRDVRIHYPGRLPWELSGVSGGETSLYEPWVNGASFITDRTMASGQCPHKHTLKWFSGAENPPTEEPKPPGMDGLTAPLKPDIVALLNWGAGTLRLNGKPTVPQWVRIYVPVEVKKHSDIKSALLQLLSYMRQVLRECADRRFVVGLTQAGLNLRVYIADRSGVLGSKRVNIEQNPLDFVRVIQGITVAEPRQLGWDPTMMKCQMPPENGVEAAKLYAFAQWASYEDPPASVASTSSDSVQLQLCWVMTIDVQRSEETPAVEERFVLFQPLSLLRGEVIMGRATRVWKAWKWEDIVKPRKDRKIYIVKDCWRDEERGVEGAFYAQLHGAKGVATMYGYGVVRVTVNGQKTADDTLNVIRNGLKANKTPHAIDFKQRVVLPEPPTGGDIKSVPRYAPEEWDDYLPETKESKTGGPRNRIHSRLILATYGWPIKYACSLLELVSVMKHAITGHCNAFASGAGNKKGVLHRDISIGNILIVQGSSPEVPQGALIDFDNAVFWENHRSVRSDPLTGTLPFMSGELLDDTQYWPKTGPKPTRIPHTFMHDLESFFWVLVWLCLTRGGPAARRHCLDHDADRNKELDKQLRKFFEHDDMEVLATHKRDIFRQLDNEEIPSWNLNDILGCLSEFTSPLSDLIRNFFRVIQNACRQNNRDLHAAVIAEFDKAEIELMKNPPSLTPKMKEQLRSEIGRRNKETGSVRDEDSKYVEKNATDARAIGTWDDSPSQVRIARTDELPEELRDRPEAENPSRQHLGNYTLPKEPPSPSPQGPYPPQPQSSLDPRDKRRKIDNDTTPRSRR